MACSKTNKLTNAGCDKGVTTSQVVNEKHIKEEMLWFISNFTAHTELRSFVRNILLRMPQQSKVEKTENSPFCEQMHSVLLAWKILFKGKSFISREIKVYSLTYSKTQSSVAEEALAFYIYHTVKVIVLY